MKETTQRINQLGEFRKNNLEQLDRAESAYRFDPSLSAKSEQERSDVMAKARLAAKLQMEAGNLIGAQPSSKMVSLHGEAEARSILGKEQEETDKLARNLIEGVGRTAFELADAQLEQEAVKKEGKKHFNENQAAYHDLAAVEAYQDGVHLNVEHPLHQASATQDSSTPRE